MREAIGRRDDAAPLQTSKRLPALDPAASARNPGPVAAPALALQRTAGNRATGRALARWTAHPDKDQKGVLVPDGVAADYLRFNPPKNQ